MRTRPLLAAVSLLLFGLASAAVAQESPRTIQVIGAGSSDAAPQELTVQGSLSATGESAKESYELFLQSKEAVRTTFDGMVFPSLQIEFHGEKMIDPLANANAGLPFAMADDGGFAVEEVQSVGATEEITLRISGIDKMDDVVLRDMILEILDRAKETGLSIGSKPNPLATVYGYNSEPAGLISYELNSIDDVRAEAYSAAMVDAKKRADSLAKLSNGRIGRVLAIEQLAESGAGSDEFNPLVFALQLNGDSNSLAISQLTADRPGPLTLNVQLQVVYELLDE